MPKVIKNFYKLVIPKSPDSINKVVKYGKKEGDVVVLKHKWERFAQLYIRKARDEGILPDHFQGKIGVHFKLYFETQRERDGDNYNLMCKGILDAFVKENMIFDDNHIFVDDNGRRIKVDPDRPRAEVHIIEKVDPNRVVEINYGEQKSNTNSNRSEFGDYQDSRI